MPLGVWVFVVLHKLGCRLQELDGEEMIEIVFSSLVGNVNSKHRVEQGK